MEKQEVELGDIVKDIHTGFTGTALSKLEYFNGCIQFEVIPKLKRGETKQPEGVFIDIQSLVILKKFRKVEKEDEEDNGGAYHKHIKMRGY